MSALQATLKPSVNLVRKGPRGRAPVVFVHPVGLDLTCWGAQIEALCGLAEITGVAARA
jgi:hypothetical protein